jgi:NADH:ubiquinone oxidoreductase subunit
MSESTERYIVRDARDGRDESIEIEDPWQIVDTETNEVVEAQESRRWADLTAREWNQTVENDPTMTPRRYEAMGSLQRATNARRLAEKERVAP